MRQTILKLLCHPRKFCRHIPLIIDIWHAEKAGNRIEIDDISCLHNVRIACMGRGNHLHIHGNTCVRNSYISFNGDGGEIVIHEGCDVNAKKHKPLRLHVRHNTTIEIGESCLISDGVEMWTTDYHQVIDIATGKRVNHDANIRIGDNCWIGRNVTINKGVAIAPNNIIGNGSLVTKSFGESNTVIAGNPAQVRKNGITWRY